MTTSLAYADMTRDVLKLLSIWQTLDDATIRRFAMEEYHIELRDSELTQFRDTTGLSNPRFRLLGKKVTEWALAKALGQHGYRGRTRAHLVASCTEACEQYIHGKFSPLLIGEWVDDIYEEMGAYSSRPMHYRQVAAEKWGELLMLLRKNG
jgi:hypothetical protein